MAKKSISLLTMRSQKILAKKLNDEDLLLIATMSGDVYRGKCPVEIFQATEKQMIEKYGLTVR